MTRMDELARAVQEGERAKREMERLAALPNLGELENGAVIAATVRFNRGGPAYTYIGYKEQDRWYFTGKQAPSGVTSDDAAAWLAKSGRRVLQILHLATYTAELVDVVAVDLGDMLSQVLEYSGRRPRSMEYPDGVAAPGGPFGNGR
jgi:hypothetical protein